MKPVIKWENCTHCGYCINLCPESIFTWAEDGLLMMEETDLCIECGICENSCPQNAITLE